MFGLSERRACDGCCHRCKVVSCLRVAKDQQDEAWIVD